MKKITINEKEYKIKYTLRALFIFEQITGRSFEMHTMMDNYLFFYCMIVANNPENFLTWDEFIDALDENPNLLIEFTAITDELNDKNTLLGDEVSEEGEEKKS